MKKFWLGFIALLVFGIFLTGCNSTTSQESATVDMDTDESIVLPVSDVTDGTGVQGTWILDQDTDDVEDGRDDGNLEATDETMVLALNSDDSFEQYVGEDTVGFVNVTTNTLLDGTYKLTDTTLELTYDEDQSGFNAAANDTNLITYDYTLDGDTLTLKADGNTLVLTREK